MNIWRRGDGPSRIYVFRGGERPSWTWDPLPGRFVIRGDWSRVRQLLYRVAIFLGWRPIVPMLPMEGPRDDDGLLGAGVPRVPPDSWGSASAAAVPPLDGTWSDET